MVFDLEYDYDACLARHPTVRISDIQDLKEWAQSLESNSTVPKDITDKQLLVFHLACQQDLEDTKKCIKIHFNLKAKAPELFDNRDPSTEDMQQTQEVQEHIFLPVRTDEGYGVLMHRLHDYDVDKYSFSVGCKYYSMSLDAHINENGPDQGIVLLFDMQGVKLGHVARVSIGALAKYLAFVQEGLQARIISVHVVNVVPLFDKVMKIIKPFLKGDLIKRIILHPPTMDWEEFYRDAIPKKCLPSDFGGDLPDTRALHKINTETVIRNKQYFIAETKQRHFCSKPDKKKGTVERFTSLDID